MRSSMLRSKLLPKRLSLISLPFPVMIFVGFHWGILVLNSIVFLYWFISFWFDPPCDILVERASEATMSDGFGWYYFLYIVPFMTQHRLRGHPSCVLSIIIFTPRSFEFIIYVSKYLSTSRHVILSYLCFLNFCVPFENRNKDYFSQHILIASLSHKSKRRIT